MMENQRLSINKDETSDHDNSDLRNICRLCLKKVEEKLFKIFAETTDIFISLRIMSCTGVEVTNTDSFPKHICLDCRYQLEKFFLFRNKCKNSDSKLRRHFWLINSGKKSRIFDDSDDEFEGNFEESEKIIEELERTLNINTQTNEDSLSEKFKKDLREAIEQETQRIYREAKERYDIQLKTVTKAQKNKKPLTQQPETGLSEKRLNAPKSKIKNELADVFIQDDHYWNEVSSTEVLSGDASLSKHNQNKCEDYIVHYDVNLMDSTENEEELLLHYDSETENIKNSISHSSYTLLDSGDIKPTDYSTDTIELYIEEDSHTAPEYLEDEHNDDNNPLEDNYDLILPAIKKTIASQKELAINVDRIVKYDIQKKSGRVIEVQCTTNDGNIIYVEMEESYLNNNPDEQYDDNGEIKVFHCKKCSTSFSRRGQLLSHMRSHDINKRGLKCSYCQKWFPSNSTLTRHTRVHTGEKPFKCETCGRAFIQKEILKRHIMIHTGERPFQCLKCDKSFILRDTLKQHINRHHLKTPIVETHECPLCPKKFMHSSGLSRHLLIHAGKTFNCDHCSKSFNDRSALKRHLATIHKVVFPKVEKLKSEIRVNSETEDSI